MSVRFYTSKGKRCKSAPEPASSSSDSDDDDRKDKISHEVYKTAGLDQALHRRLDYVRAVQELTALVRLYSDLPKATQDQVVADAHTAASCCDGSTYHQQALNLLLMTIEQHFPRTKRLACIRDAKQAGVLRAREQKKAAALCDESAVRWQDLPDEILLLVFAKLEPLDLSRASCACVAWDSLAGSNSLWQKFLPNACPASSAVRSSKISFLGQPPIIVRKWRSRRQILNHKLSWRIGPVDLESSNVSMLRGTQGIQDVLWYLKFLTNLGRRRKQIRTAAPDG